MKTSLPFSCTMALCLFAITAFAQDMIAAPNREKALIAHADSLIANYKFKKALQVLAEGDSLDINILLRIGQCNFRLGASRAAIEPYERVLKIDSGNIAALNQLGQLYIRDGDFAEAFTNYLKLIQLDSTNNVYCRLAGTTALRLGDATASMHWLTKALHFNSSDTEASLALGNLLLEMEHFEMVDSITRLALTADPNLKPMLLLSAKSTFEQQDYNSTISTVNRLLEKTDTRAQLARLLGISYFHLQEHAKLVTCMQFLLRNRFDFEWIYYYMGISFRELGDVTGSVGWFKLAVEKSISENTKTYYAQLAQSYEEMGNYQEAIRAYRAAYNYSRDGIMLYHLARNYDVFYKDKSIALEYYKKYLESDDTIRLAREYAKKRMQDMGHF